MLYYIFIVKAKLSMSLSHYMSIQDKKMKEILKALDKESIRISMPLREKYPLIKDWVNYKEKRSIEQILNEGNLGLRTGTKPWRDYYFCVLDLDGKSWTRILSNQRVSYVRTAKGIHVYLKVRSQIVLPNGILYCQGRRIGDFLSKGKQVVGVGSTHETGFIYKLVKRGKWFWKFESIEELKGKLAKYRVELK